jgi:pilus assembly protein Flp/PilA
MNLGCYVRQMNLNTQKTKLEGIKMERIRNFFKDESGAAAVEYGLLVALIAVVIIGAVTALGTQVQTTFDSAKTGLGG